MPGDISRVRLQHISEALIASGYTTLDQQAKARILARTGGVRERSGKAAAL